MQDREGYIWFYTEKGVSKFDGYSFKNYQTELPNYDVWGLTEDSQGRLWVHAIHHRLVYIYQDSIHEVTTPGNIRFHINSLNESDGIVWFPTSSSFEGSKKSSENFYIRNDSAIYVPGSLGDIKYSIPRAEGEPLIFLYTRKNFICIGVDSLFRYDYNGKLLIKKAIDNSNNWIEKCYNTLLGYTGSYRIIKNELTFICGNDKTGILKWDDDKEIGKSLRYDDIYDYPVNPDYIPGYLLDSSFQVTLMPAPGFLEVDLDLNVIDTFAVSGINYRRIFKDRQGNYWITTNDDGVYFISADARNTASYRSENDNNITRILGHENGQIFFGTIKGGLYVLQNQQELITLITSNEIGANLRGLSLTADGKIYAGSDLGQVEITMAEPIDKSLSKSFKDFNLMKDKTYPLTDETYNRKFNEYTKASIYDDKNSMLWISNGQYVGYVNFSKPAALETNIFQLNGIDELALGQNKEVWAAGSGGVWLIKKNEAEGMQNDHEFFRKNVKSLTVDKYNILWVATDRNGVFGFKNDSIYRIPESKNSIANDLFFDKEGFLWAGTDKGIQQYKIDPDNYDRQELIRTYNTNDGILTNEINAIFVNEKYIYAGTSKGLSKIDKTGKYGDDSRPQLRIQNIRINGKSKKVVNKYVLDHEQSSIEIDFVALSYKSLRAIDYRYQLKGVDAEWQETRNTTLRYASLAPGKYTFHLQATDIENRASEWLEPLVFEIRSPVWERAWFRALVLAIIAGLIWLIYRSSVNAIKKDEAEKTRIAKEMAELELKALQAQMNPHFVFNALTSIRYYIQNNQPDEAGDYLARFAKLMRLFLESSKNNMASLDDEIRLLSLYIEMEQLRFEKQFSFELTVDKDLNVYTIKIPTLLLQPFVENSISHGLFHKENKGLLKIDFQLEGEETITCTIEDDGIGREAAATIAARSTKGHKSRGMQIVEERLEVLQQKDGLDVRIEFVDLKGGDGKNAGTRVVLRIPLLD